MKERSLKERIYWYIDLLLKGEIDCSSFADSFYRAFDLRLSFYEEEEVPSDLKELEEFEFSKLGQIVSRYSPFPEDHKLYPGVYYTEEEVKEAARNALANLGIGNDNK